MAVTYNLTGVGRNEKSIRNGRKRCDRYVYSVWRDGLGKLVQIEMPVGKEPVIPNTINLASDAAEWQQKLHAANKDRIV